MASMQSELELAFTDVGTNIKATKALIGLLASLSTTDKTNLVAAINEVNSKTAAAGAQINDVTPSSTTAYSSNKTDAQIASSRAALKTEILGGAGTTVDTLKEIADLLTASDLNDDNALAALTTAVGNRIRFDAAQTLTDVQKAQANTNAGSVSLVQLGDPARNYRTVLATALA